jgi:hypothetical protein
MKKSFIAAVAALSLTGMTVAIAGPQSLEEAAKAGSVQISKGAAHYTLGTAEFKDYSYSYKMDNGQTVRFSEVGNRYYVELKGEPRTRLLPTAEGKFTTEQGTDFAFADFGDTVAITNLHRLPMSVAMAPVEGPVVARR